MTPTVTRRSTEAAHVPYSPEADAAGRHPAVPTQRAADPLRPLPRPDTTWEGYRNAGPDCYWAAEQGDPGLS